MPVEVVRSPQTSLGLPVISIGGASTNVTSGAGSQLSEAVAVPVADGVVGLGHCTSASAGMTIVGSTVSLTVTVKVQGRLALPQASVAAQTTGVTSAGKVFGDVMATPLVRQTTVEALHRSVAVGAVKLTSSPPTCEQVTMMFGGQAPSVGGVVSRTVMVCTKAVLVLPHESVKVQDRTST